MTLEEMVAAFEAYKSETAEKIAALEQTNAETQEENERLRRHAAKVLAEKKKLKAKKKSVDEDDEDEAETVETNDGDADAVARVRREYEARIAAMEKKLSDDRAKRERVAIDASLKDALGKAKVLPHFMPAVEAMMKARKVVVKDDAVEIDGQEVSAFVASWAASDDGKHYVAAPANGGGIERPTKPVTVRRAEPVSDKVRSLAERGRMYREQAGG